MKRGLSQRLWVLGSSYRKIRLLSSSDGYASSLSMESAGVFFVSEAGASALWFSFSASRRNRASLLAIH